MCFFLVFTKVNFLGNPAEINVFERVYRSQRAAGENFGVPMGRQAILLQKIALKIDFWMHKFPEA